MLRYFNGCFIGMLLLCCILDDVIKWRHFPRNWPFVRGNPRSLVNSPHKGQWRGALMFSLICVWIKGWVNNRQAGDLRRDRAHYDVIVMAATQHSSQNNGNSPITKPIVDGFRKPLFQVHENIMGKPSPFWSFVMLYTLHYVMIYTWFWLFCGNRAI